MNEMQPIYLDNNATTPVAPEVVDAILPYLRTHFGNPSSKHSLGRAAHQAIEKARGQVARLLGTDSDQILFTSGGTESNNLAIQGTMLNGFPDERGHLIISAFEHPATTAPAEFLQRLGIAVSIVPANRDGIVEPAAVAAAIRDDTRLVSIMHANNEIGTVQPIREIADLCHEQGVLIHTDAAQSIGKVETLVDRLGVDFLSVAGHKMYAPKGVGALYIRRGNALEPVLHGAGHERGVRPGTENTPYIVGLGKAAAMACDSAADFQAQMADRSGKLLELLKSSIGDELTLNGEGVARLPNTLSLNFPRVIGGELLAAIPELCASTGSACHSGTTNMSATLQAIGLQPEVAQGTVRLSLGWHTSDAEVERAAGLLVEGWRQLADEQL